MLILAFDTSAMAGSVALLEDDQTLSERQLAAGRRSAQTLAPAIREMLDGLAFSPPAVELVATTVGPGSFTGLRVGVTTAKTFAYAAGCAVIGLDTLDVIAHQAAAGHANSPAREIHAAIDAGRRELYLARFNTTGSSLMRIEPDRIVPLHQWLALLQPGTLVAGTGLRMAAGQLPAGVLAADPRLYEPQAITIGRMALAEYRRGRRDDLWKLVPAYVRSSAAEEKAAKKKSPSEPPSTTP